MVFNCSCSCPRVHFFGHLKMNDALLFSGRDARRTAIPQEYYEQLTQMGKSIGETEDYADRKIDEALTIRWLAKRTGRHESVIEATLPSVMANYFGKSEITPSQAYEWIMDAEASQKQGG